MEPLRTFLYSIKEDENGTLSLSIDLGKHVQSDIGDSIQLLLPQGPATLPKRMYLNTDRIFDNNKVFFYVCSKQINREYIFKKLLEYRINKFETYVNYFDAKINLYRKELNSLKLKAA